jgi:uncharacterized protein
MAGPRMMAVPFAIDALGRVAFTEDPIEQITEKVRMVVGTRFGERCMRPRYGADLDPFIFGFNDDVAVTMVQTEITNALGQWLPSVTVTDVRTMSTDDSALAIAVDYTIPTTSSSDPTVYTAIIEVGGTVVAA